jgi:hypothetical protein
MKNRYAKTLIILFLLSVQAQALNDINLTIDNQGAGICISSNNLTNQICNQTQVLVLDGTKDHFLYFTYPQESQVQTNQSYVERGVDAVTIFFEVMIVILSVFMLAFIIIAIFYGIKQIFGF